jgi:hypothetical protein
MATDMTNKRKRGRPPVDPQVSRSQRVVTFVTAQEFALINDLAQVQEKTLSTTVYSMLRESLACLHNEPT